jgi:hypothetical protein
MGDITTEQLRDMIEKSGEMGNTKDLYLYYRISYELDNSHRMDRLLYDHILEEAKQQNKPAVYILLTPIGVWRFNLDFFKPEEGATQVYLNTSKGTPMLPWYPSYNSEEEWIEEQMIQYADEEPYVDDLELLIEEMINSEVDFDNEYLTNE